MLDDSRLAIRIGDWSIDPSLNRLDREGACVFVRPRVMDLLVYLHARPGEVVGLDDIMDAIWKGTIVTTGSVYGCINELRDALGDHQDAPSYIETIPKRGYRLIAETGALHETASMEERSLAVLPFEILSPAAEDAYFADGIHEEILTQLGKVRDMAVIARTSVLAYANTNKAVPVIARELGVAKVLEGSVRYAGRRVRITAQLIDGTKGTHVWSESYDRDLGDIFAIQSDIATKITEAMKTELSFSEQQSIAAAPTENLDAYAYYLRALSQHRYMQQPAQMHDELDGALAQDPEFALALATKAWMYSHQIAVPLEGAEITPDSQHRYARLTRLFAGRAMALAPDLGLAHLALAPVNSYELRWKDCVSNVDQAYRLEPNEPMNVITLAIDLTLQGQLKAAIPLYEKFFRLDPANWGSTLFAADKMGANGSLDLAIEYAHRIVSLAPELHYGYSILFRMFAISGKVEEALENAARSEALLPERPDIVSILDLMEAYYWIDRGDDATRLFNFLQASAETRTISHGDLFRAYFALGEFERALDHLEAAIKAHFPAGYGQAVGNLLVSRFYEPLWGNPRFEDAVKRVGLEEVYQRPTPLLTAIKR